MHIVDREMMCDREDAVVNYRSYTATDEITLCAFNSRLEILPHRTVPVEG